MGAGGQLYGAARSQYAEYNSQLQTQPQEHKHGHERSTSRDSTYTLKPFLNGSMGRPKGRPRGDSDLGRVIPKKTPVIDRYGFSPVSPIEETAHAHSPLPPA